MHLRFSGPNMWIACHWTRYAALPALIFTGMPLSAEEEAVARKLNAPVFYKPQPYSVLIQHLNRQLQRRPAPARLDN